MIMVWLYDGTQVEVPETLGELLEMPEGERPQYLNGMGPREFRLPEVLSPHWYRTATCEGSTPCLHGSEGSSTWGHSLPAGNYRTPDGRQVAATSLRLGWRATVPMTERPHPATPEGVAAELVAAEGTDRQRAWDLRLVLVRELGRDEADRLIAAARPRVPPPLNQRQQANVLAVLDAIRARHPELARWLESVRRKLPRRPSSPPRG